MRGVVSKHSHVSLLHIYKEITNKLINGVFLLLSSYRLVFPYLKHLTILSFPYKSCSRTVVFKIFSSYITKYSIISCLFSIISIQLLFLLLLFLYTLSECPFCMIPVQEYLCLDFLFPWLRRPMYEQTRSQHLRPSLSFPLRPRHTTLPDTFTCVVVDTQKHFTTEYKVW